MTPPLSTLTLMLTVNITVSGIAAKLFTVQLCDSIACVAPSVSQKLGWYANAIAILHTRWLRLLCAHADYASIFGVTPCAA